MKIILSSIFFCCLARALLAYAGNFGAEEFYDHNDVLDADADYQPLASDGDFAIIASDGDPEEALAAMKAYPPIDPVQLRLDDSRGDRTCSRPVSMEEYWLMKHDAAPISDFDVSVTCGPVYFDDE